MGGHIVLDNGVFRVLKIQILVKSRGKLMLNSNAETLKIRKFLVLAVR